MQLIPAIDLRHGEVVRLTHGDDAQRTRYGVDPRAVLAEYTAAGVELVHVVDLDAAFGEAPQRPLLTELAAQARTDHARIELGGGLRDAAAVRWALEEAGCERVILGSMVARDFPAFERIVEACPGGVVPALEVAAGKLKIAGWTEDAGIPLEDLAQRLRGLPCPAVLVTDVDRDGTLRGPNLDLAQRVGELSSLPALLSGGVQGADDLRAAARIPSIGGAIVGKALYEGRFTLREALAACRGDAS